MCALVSYQKDFPGATSSAPKETACGVESTILQLVEMLRAGSADPVFIALQLAKYSTAVPEVKPLVNQLAVSFTDKIRTKVLLRLNQTHLGGHKTAEEIVPQEQVQPPDQPLEIRADPELSRIALGLGLAAPLRIWLVLRQQFGNPGWTTRKTLYKALSDAGITLSGRHYNRLLKTGSGAFWGLSDDGRVWLRGYRRVAETLTTQAMAANPDLVLTNYPGVRDIYVRVDGPLKRFKARLYAAWLTHRENPKIARATLCKLFATTTETLQAWERELPRIITVVPSYTQTAIDPKEDDRIVDYLPDHAYSYLTRRNEVRLRWQSPNVYRTRLIRQHPHKGQSRKVRVAAAKVVTSAHAEARSAENRAEMSPERDIAFGRDHWEQRQYFAGAEALRRFLKRFEEDRAVVLTSPETPRYVFCGRDRNDHVIYELSLDGEVVTDAWERLSIKKEYIWRKAEANHRKGWQMSLAAR